MNFGEFERRLNVDNEWKREYVLTLQQFTARILKHVYDTHPIERLDEFGLLNFFPQEDLESIQKQHRFTDADMNSLSEHF